MNKLKFKGHYRVEHIRNGKVLSVKHIDNAVVEEGINSILDVYFNSSSQFTTWYIGLIGSAVAGDLLDSDTMSSHPNWTEEQSYTELVRQTWTSGAASNKSITNSAYVAFSINATVTISGLFCCSDNTKGGTSGTLWATGLFTDGDISAVSGDTLNITYTVTGAAS